MKKTIFTIALCLVAIISIGQFKYLGSYTADGKPNYLATSDVVSNATMDLVKLALPEGKPVPIYNPQYIYSGYASDILLRDSAEVWVTFVDEGAGYRNVLGFYTYNLNNPLTSAPNDTSITIIFPNISKVGSGGSLEAGNKVKLGNFSKNTGIGFILLADGWRNGAVTNGLWKLYSNSAFNPEANPARKQHNALLADPENNRIILGFEDIRRDNASCDNDFNDALFYITASPYVAIVTDNVAPIDTSFTSVTSGNDGGLESNGRLANKIASQMFKRQVSNASKLAQKSYQKKVDNIVFDGFTGALKDYLPTTGINGTEEAFESTPTDLINITNAKDIYSLDYYLGSKRVNAALLTHTENKVYDHSKYICDRLNGSTLQDVRVMEIENFKIINTTLKRANGEIEYALTFSAKVTDSNFSIFSIWNIDEYPTGEYLNFQIWGSSVAQIFNTATNIINKLSLQKSVVANNNLTILPKVFIKKGEYKNGKYYLNVINKAGVKSINLESNYRKTETDGFNNFSSVIALSGAHEELVEVNIGQIFDAGLRVSQTGASQSDNLYLADGAWGTDYDSNFSNNIVFKSSVSDTKISDANTFYVERNIEAKGSNKGSFNVFRSLKPGNCVADLSNFKKVSFELYTQSEIEVVIIEKSLMDWNKRKKYTIRVNASKKLYDIDLNLFVDEDGNKLNLKEVRSILFSVKGNYQNFTNFSIALKNVSFNNNATTVLNEQNSITAFPNPCTTTAILTFKSNTTEGLLNVSDATGKLVFTQNIKLTNKTFNLPVQNFQKGMYVVSYSSGNNEKMFTKILVK